ncbi:MAG: GNAT family N-acetyltransferase [Planctomycetota bacterium]
MQGPQIRTAGTKDAAAIARVQVDSWRGAYKDVMSPEILDALDVEAKTDLWKILLGDADQFCLVATTDGNIAGFVAMSASPDDDHDPSRVADIGALYVEPKQWQKGIGSKLICHGLDRLREQGFNKAALWVLEGNEMGRTFYEKHGFTNDGGKKVHPRSGLVELRYEIDLSGIG